MYIPDRQVIPNQTALELVERRKITDGKTDEVRLETRKLPILGWVINLSDAERSNFFVGLPVIPDDVRDGFWGIRDPNTGIVIDQFETEYAALEWFEKDMDNRLLRFGDD